MLSLQGNLDKYTDFSRISDIKTRTSWQCSDVLVFFDAGTGLHVPDRIVRSISGSIE